jgi:hypothetical protein
MASFALFSPKDENKIHPAHCVLVRESFSVWGFLLPLPYCLWQGNWRFSGLLIATGLLMGSLPLIGIEINEFSALGLEMLMGLYVGCAAADIRAAALERRGFYLIDVILASNEEAALLRFLDQHLMAGVPVASHSPSFQNPSSPATQPMPARAFGSSDVLGLFPESQR